MKLLVTLLTIIVCVNQSSAESSIGYGVHTGYAGCGDCKGLISGLHIKGFNVTSSIVLVPNVEVVFYDESTLYSFDIDANYRIYNSISGLIPYVGGSIGINVWNYDNVPPGMDGTEGKYVIDAQFGIEKYINDTTLFMIEIQIGPSEWSPNLELIAGITFY